MTDIQIRKFQSTVYQNTTWETITHSVQSRTTYTEYTTHKITGSDNEKPSFNTVSIIVCDYGTFKHSAHFTERRWLMSESMNSFSVHIQCNLNIFFCHNNLEILEPVLYAVWSMGKEPISHSRNYTVWKRTSLQQKHRIDQNKFQANSIPLKKRLTNYCIFFH